MVICQCAILNYQRVNKIIIPFIFHWLFMTISYYFMIYLPFIHQYSHYKILKWPCIVDFLIKNGDFPWLFVCSPEGTPLPWHFFQHCSPGRRSRPRPCAPPCAPPWRACQRLSVPRCATCQFNQEHLGLISWKKTRTSGCCSILINMKHQPSL